MTTPVKLKAAQKKSVDRYAEVALAIKELEKERASLKPVVVELGLDAGPLVGNEHILLVTHAPRSALSVELAKGHLTVAEIIECTVTTDVVTVRVEV